MQRLQYPKQNKVDNLNNARLEVSRQFRKKRRNIGKLDLIILKLTARYYISGSFIGASIILRRFTNLELIQQRM